MSNIDPVVLATLRNKSGNENLKEQLARVDRNNQSAMRMIKTAQQRLNHKYRFQKNAILASPKVAESRNIRMYETHNPGFCYRKDGTCRRTIAATEEKSHAYEELQDLLFTDEAIDVRKVACLHVLAAHSPEVHSEIWDECCKGFSTSGSCQPTSACLRPVMRAIMSSRSGNRGSHSGLLPVKYSKSERSTSKQAKTELSFTKLLPLYLVAGPCKEGRTPFDKKLVDKTTSSEEVLIREEILDNPSQIFASLAEDKFIGTNIDIEKDITVYVNSEIELIVDTIMEALQDSNPQKMNDIIKLLHNPLEVREMFRQPKTKRFLEALRGNGLLYCGKCFRSIYAKLVRNPVKKLKVDLLKVKPKEWRIRVGSKDLEMTAVRMQITNIPESLDRIITEIGHNVIREVLSASGIVLPKTPLHLLLDLDEEGKVKNKAERDTRRGAPIHINYEDITGQYEEVAAGNEVCKCAEEEITKEDLAAKRGSHESAMKPRTVSKSELDKKESCMCAEELIAAVAAAGTKFSLRRACCEACNQQWRLQEVSIGGPQNVKSSDVKNHMLDRPALIHLEKQRASGQKVLQESLDKLKSNYGITDEMLSEPNKLTRMSFRKRVDREAIKNNILRRLSNSQRLLIGMRAARLKSHEVNIEGNVDATVKSPLRELVGPVLSKEAIMAITTPEEEYERDLLLFSKVQDLPSDAFIPRRAMESLAARRSLNMEQPRRILSVHQPPAGRTDLPVKVTAINIAQLKLTVKTNETKKKVTDFLKESKS